jgi:cyclohexanecarboxylate-CoA ligase
MWLSERIARYNRAGGPWDVPPASQLSPPRVFSDGRWLSSPEVEDLIHPVAGALRARGVEPGDVVAFQLAPSPDGLLIFFAAWRLGAVAMPIHHRYTPTEAEEIARRASARVLLRPADIESLHAGRPYEERADVDVAAPALLLATSGSSGRPKIAVHSHRSLMHKAVTSSKAHGLGDSDVALMPAPTAHMGGVLCGILVPSYAEMGAVYMPRWSATVALELIEAAKVSFMVGPPTFYVQMLRTPTFVPSMTQSLHLVSCGGAGVDARFCEQASQALGAWVKRTYGSTEAPTVTTSLAGEPWELGWTNDGRPFGECEIVIDPETNEIMIRGPELFDGYLDDSIDPFDDEGWYRSGDKGRMENGRLSVIGRIRNMAIRGGENIDLSEVEDVCGRYPDVSQVVAIGVPDDMMGERLALVVESDSLVTLDDMREFCAANGLARFKTPEYVLTIGELPTNSLGKVDRIGVTELLRGIAKP